MHFDILTLFPNMFRGPFEESIVARARAKGLVSVAIYDIRRFATDRHRTVDDYPYGGGAGMVMKPGPIFAAHEAVLAGEAEPDAGDKCPIVLPTSTRTILMSPQGRLFGQPVAKKIAALDRVILLCGHYEGVDERVRVRLVDQELSVGDYVLTGGELPAMVVVDAVVRLLPGVLGDDYSSVEESHAAGLLEHPHYTRPPVYGDMAVPEVLLSGNHALIARWRREQSLLRTMRRRPDLLAAADLTEKERHWLAEQATADAEGDGAS